jgi:hypothetical protein
VSESRKIEQKKEDWEEKNLPEQVPHMTKHVQQVVEMNIKRDVEPDIKEDEKEKQEDAASFGKVARGATLSEDHLLSIRWKKTGNLTTYLHNLATFLGNFPDLAVKQDENVELVFPSQLQVLTSCVFRN